MIPWRQKNSDVMARAAEQDNLAEIESEKVKSLEKRATAAKREETAGRCPDIWQPVCNNHTVFTEMVVFLGIKFAHARLPTQKCRTSTQTSSYQAIQELLQNEPLGRADS